MKQIISKNIVTYLGQNVRTVFNKIIEDVKNETGVFYIYNHYNEIIYIEASKNIKNRINRLFTSNKFIPKSIQNNIKNVEVEATGSFGYGFYELNNQINTKKKLYSRLININQNQNVDNILNYIITKQKFKKLIPLNKIYITSTIE